MNIDLPTNVLKVFEVLEKHDKEVYLVGGCVRDVFLNRKPKDYDFASDARPEEMIGIFKSDGLKTIPTGIDFGTVTVVIEADSFEITTYRSDGNYSDGRRPSEVEFSRSIDEDLKRRDFTMNALALNPKSGVIDNHKGIEDLRSGIIKAVGHAESRLNEDFLRAFRAIRFANQLDMKLELPIIRAIENNYRLVENVSKERINTELNKTILSGNNLKYFRLLSLLLKEVLPEFHESFKTQQNHPCHAYNVGEHTVRVMDSIENQLPLKLTALLHDMGKTECKFTDEEQIDHFYGHNKEGQAIALRFLKDLKYSNDIIDRVGTLVLYHDRQIEPTKVSVKRVLNKLGEQVFLDLLKIKRADIKGQNPEFIDRLKNIDLLEEIYKEIIEEDQCFKLKDLKLDGNDLIDIGVIRGKSVGKVLNDLLEKVIDFPELNTKEDLTKMVEEYIKKSNDEEKAEVDKEQ